LASACVTISDSENFSFADITAISATTDKGVIEYNGRETALETDVKITSWARAAGRKKAQNKQSENRYSADAAGGILTITGDTSFEQAGIDVDITGPQNMNLGLTNGAKSIWVRDVIGVADINGNTVNLENYEGDANITSSGDVTADVYPFEEGIIDIYSDIGDCIVYLPEYAPLAIEVEFDPEEESAFADLGFDDVFLGDGAYTATRMPGNIVVNIRCPSGSVDIRTHSLSW
jgi:hypothetical protein